MTTVPGTCFTKEQLEVDLKVDNVSDGDCTGSDRLNHYGYVYYSDKKQYDKALAWSILAAMENNSYAQSSIGELYRDGLAVPINYLCALKWYLKAAEQCEYEYTPNNIGWLFENGYGVPLDKYKALEWYCHGEIKTHRDTLKSEGYHLSASDMEKSIEQLRKDTEAILDAEKKKLEEKQHKTQQEMETLVDLNITYKLTGGGQNAWKDVPILLSGSFAGCFYEMKKQVQMLSQENSTFKDQDVELQSLKQEKETMEQEKMSTTNEMGRLNASKSTLEQLLKAKQDTIVLLNRENQLISTANQGNQKGANEMVDTLKSLLQSKNSEIELNNLKMENALDKEKEKNKKLLREIKRLKQHQQPSSSRETRPSSSTTVPEATTSSDTAVPESTASNTGTNEDDPNNDFNYDTPSSTGHSSDDTSSEDGDHVNDLNYDSDV